MAKQLSNAQKKPARRFRDGFRYKKTDVRDRIWAKKAGRIRLHRSFRRSYREDYVRPLETPGLLHHAVSTFMLIFRNWRLFIPLILLTAVLNVVLVGLMSEDTYVELQHALDESTAEIQNGNLNAAAKGGLLLVSTVASGGLTSGMSEVQQVFAVILFLITWLVSIYLARQLLAGRHPKLRDGLYNALTPLISTFVVLLVILLQLIPIFIVIITYSAAIATEFLNTPFYALIFFIFASLLILLSIYLLSSSFLALVAVTAPGLYPMVAVRSASDLVAGRRIKLLIRLIFFIILFAILWVFVMFPLILLDLWLKSKIDWLNGIPFVSFELLLMTIFTVVYFSLYSYLYYRRMLDFDT